MSGPNTLSLLRLHRYRYFQLTVQNRSAPAADFKNDDLEVKALVGKTGDHQLNLNEGTFKKIRHAVVATYKVSRPFVRPLAVIRIA